ncbi:ABC transporter ATP-binding protein [Haloglomus salinum]|uniref:ABC transporter ATP-binding protein n=1 Tax=Haloglomus salinum TaxID=2962673 RepID=UPI0020C963CB|nr:ABC transporter ATP-binding protein [Haloglomus salinum]
MSEDIGVAAGADGAEAGGADGAEAGGADASLGADTETPLELTNVVKAYESGAETVRALKGVDFAVERGEFVSVIGPSGSGKSTMLNMLGLLDTPTSGEVLLDGVDAATYDDTQRTDARREYIGFVFQQFYLIDALTAVENVTLPTVYQRDPGAEARAEDLLRRVGLGDRLDHRPTQLSGGQKQRVAIARSLINEPAVVLADEPTGNLDQETGTTILEEFAAVCEEGVAVVTVTHDPLVNEFADRVVELVDGVIRDVR